ncbi:MAG TPA: tetratricopeptide repeat protein [Candidatus Acidoferrales bacterium]|nr:tetratricopeptide repeat protein [Candidatus Acidoferrales bacterium]
MAQRRRPLILPQGLPATPRREERQLLQRLQQPLADDEFRDCLYELGCFYNKFGRNDLARQVIELLLGYCDDPQEQALCCLTLGQIAEQQKHYAAAIEHYVAGLRLRPKTKLISYLLNNNLGLCLNSEKRYAESEKFLRRAIAIDSERAAAYTNLGISLQGQGDFVGAAWAFAEAKQADPSDPRPSRLLRTLLAGRARGLAHVAHVFLRERPPAELAS